MVGQRMNCFYRVQNGWILHSSKTDEFSTKTDVLNRWANTTGEISNILYERVYGDYDDR